MSGTRAGVGSEDAAAVPPYRTGGVGKFVSDTVSVFEINFLPAIRYWYLTVLLASGFAVPWFYVTRSVAPDDPEVVGRLLAGTLVFGVTFSIGTLVGNNAVAQRFMGNLRLLITMPVSNGAYVLGSLAFSSISGTITVVALLIFGLVADVDLHVAWGLAPCLVLTVLTMAGLALFVVSFAPSLTAGNLITGLLSLAQAAASPVYFTMEQAPLLLRLLGYVSPLRYSVDGIAKSISAHGDVWTELVVLACFAAATMSLGLWRLPWREE